MLILEIMRRRSTRALVTVFTASAAVVACGSSGATPSSTAGVVAGGLAKVCAQGAKEGTFTYWASDPASDFQQIYKRFSKSYPGIKVQYLSLDSDLAVPRILTAVAAGKNPGVDLVNGEISTFEPLADRGLINRTVKWTSLGLPATRVDTAWNIVESYTQFLGIAYNPDKTKASSLPSTWQGLINPKYKGMVTVYAPGYPFLELAAGWGAAKTISYMEQLNSVDHPVSIDGGTAAMTDVSRGEYLFSTLGILDSVMAMRAAGSPIAVKFLDVIPSIGAYSVLLKGAAHPDAAACYVGWLATPAGKSAIETILGKSETTRPPGVASSVPVVITQTRASINAATQVADEAEKLWGTGS
jgi:iron(III) transport system substrate-binding protein